MTELGTLLTPITIFVLAILVGFEVISKVPATLHTPLMSGANSIHGIVLVGAMLIAASADNPLSYLLAFIAIVFGAMNVVGGYVVTDRMLQMFKRKKIGRDGPAAASGRPDAGSGGRGCAARPRQAIDIVTTLAWLVGAACFVLGLHQMNSPATARNGNLLSAGRHDHRRRGHARRPARPRRRASVRVGDHRRRLRDRRRGRPVHGPHRADDGDAAAGVAVQRGRRRRGRPGRDR